MPEDLRPFHPNGEDFSILREKIRQLKEQGLDRKTRRKEITTEVAKGFSGQPLEFREEVIARSFNRYFSEYGRGNKRGFIESLHHIEPSAISIFHAIWNNPEHRAKLPQEISREELKELVFNLAVQKEKADYDELLQTGAAAAVNSLIKVLKDYNDFNTDRIIVGAVNSGYGYVKTRRDRLRVDPNADINKGTTGIAGQVTQEYPTGVALALEELTKQSLEENCQYNPERISEQPFLHLSIHGTAENPANVADIIIANAIRGKQMPCNPEIARWLAEKLNRKIEQYNLEKEPGKLFTAGVAIEGNRMSGTRGIVERRWGNELLSGFGEMYQLMQIELSRSIREKYPTQAGEIFREILDEFNSQFKTEEDLKKYIKEKETLADKTRKQGKIYLDECETDDGLEENEIRMSPSFRNALDVDAGNEVLINRRRFRVRLAQKGDSYRKPCINPGTKTYLTSPYIISAM